MEMYKKVLKRLTAVTLCVLLSVSAVIPAFAAKGNTYTIDEINGMQLTVDSEMMAVTRSTDSSDGFFSLPNNSYADVMKKMEDGNIYLLATDSRQSITVSVTMFENDDTRKIDNYNRLTESELSDIVVSYKENSNGTTYSESTVDEVVDDIVWIDFEFRATVDNAVYKQYQANTVVNGKNVSVTIQRNGADAIGSDYDVLKAIVSSVRFTKSGLPRNFMLYIIIGGAVLAIILLIIIIVVSKRARRRRQKTKNDKIIEELANKYNTGRSSSRSAKVESPVKSEAKTKAGNESYAETENVSASEDNIAKTLHFDMNKARRQSSKPAQPSERYYDYDGDDDYSRPVKSYTDEEIARLLGDDTGDDENFIEALSETEADFGVHPEEESVNSSPENVSAPEEINRDNEEALDGEALIEKDLAEYEAEKPLKDLREVFDFSKFMQNARKKADEEYGAVPTVAQPENVPEEGTPVESKVEEPEKTAREIEEVNLPEEAEPETVFDESVEEAHNPDEADETDLKEENESTDVPEEAGEGSVGTAEEIEEPEINDEDRELTKEEAEQQELDDYNNDEVLVREEAKHNKFNSSNDFFEEAPKKIIGVISREEIEDAEEFDVIDEVEKRATRVEEEPERREVKKKSFFKRAAAGFKSFVTHCGYFAKNIKKEVKRGKAKKKHKKAEEERRRRVQQRAVRQKTQTQNGGLVQVKARGQNKPKR